MAKYPSSFVASSLQKVQWLKAKPCWRVVAYRTFKVHHRQTEILVLGSIFSSSSGSGINHFLHILTLHKLWNLPYWVFSWLWWGVVLNLPFPFMTVGTELWRRSSVSSNSFFFTDFPLKSAMRFVISPVFSPLFLLSDYPSQWVKRKQQSSERMQLLKRKTRSRLE